MRVFESVGSEIYSLTMNRSGDDLKLIVVADSFSEGERILLEAAHRYHSMGWQGNAVQHISKVQGFLNGSIIVM